MKIIHLILGKANPFRMNGVNKVVHNLATHQFSLGYDVQVWGITPNPIHNYPERNYATSLFQSSKLKWTIDKELKKQILMIKERAVFHLHGGFIPEFFVAAELLTKAGIEFLFTPHGAYNSKALQKNKWLKRLYLSVVESSIINRAKAIHCIGQSEVDSFKILNYNTDSVLIPNGQQISNFTTRHLYTNGSLIMGFCGRIDIETKGLDLLMKGFSRYKKKHHGTGRLSIIGDGKDLTELMKLATDLGVENFVHFHGAQFGLDKHNLLCEMDAFYHPSRNEGLPGAVLEAASLGIPCVVSKASNMADYIGDYEAGIPLIENNEETICQSMLKIEQLHENQTIHTLGSNAIEMVFEQFDWNKISEALIQVYEK